MSWSAWKEYLTFSRKERTGILILLALIAVIYAIPEFLPEKRSVELFYNRDSIQQLTTLKNPQGPLQAGEVQRDDNRYDPPASVAKAERFPFDPNTLDEEGWHRLGVSDRTISTIINFRTKGGEFRMPSDLRKIYGLNKNICEELIPFVTIQQRGSANTRRNGFHNVERNNIPDNSKRNGFEQSNNLNFRNPPYKKSTVSIHAIDINSADSIAWEQLPAIGSKLASRIILFRERLGGFYNIRQVGETFGITDSAFQIILPYLTYAEIPLRRININTATAPELARHPYIRWNIANAIVNYRKQHGIFGEVGELRAVSMISPEVLEKLEPYLTVE